MVDDRCGILPVGAAAISEEGLQQVRARDRSAVRGPRTHVHGQSQRACVDHRDLTTATATPKWSWKLMAEGEERGGE